MFHLFEQKKNNNVGIRKIYFEKNYHLYKHSFFRRQKLGESQPHKGHLTSKLKYRTVPVLPSLVFLFHLSPSPVHPTEFSFCFFPLPYHFYLVVIEQQHPTGVSSCFFPGFLAIFILLSSNNNILPEFPPVSSLASLPFLSCCPNNGTKHWERSYTEKTSIPFPFKLNGI